MLRIHYKFRSTKLLFNVKVETRPTETSNKRKKGSFVSISVITLITIWSLSSLKVRNPSTVKYDRLFLVHRDSAWNRNINLQRQNYNQAKYTSINVWTFSMVILTCFEFSCNPLSNLVPVRNSTTLPLSMIRNLKQAANLNSAMDFQGFICKLRWFKMFCVRRLFVCFRKNHTFKIVLWIICHSLWFDLILSCMTARSIHWFVSKLSCFYVYIVTNVYIM